MKNFIWGTGPKFQNSYWFKVHGYRHGSVELSALMTEKDRDEREFLAKKTK